ncbi:hypothetical protein [Sporomusa acidovorans]|uniref:hypothetical protein n=1 Tax=Sporomusa acidovorans TaxID=112900 RepID=UPI00146E925F|nr:hypothetical protein [Sporomusa acidovorans]
MKTAPTRNRQAVHDDISIIQCRPLEDKRGIEYNGDAGKAGADCATYATED